MMATTEQQHVNDMHGDDGLFELYALGRLDRELCSRIAAHVSKCAACEASLTEAFAFVAAMTAALRIV
jgi:hypothetical protein